jgi:hypothetical protein
MPAIIFNIKKHHGIELLYCHMVASKLLNGWSRRYGPLLMY